MIVTVVAVMCKLMVALPTIAPDRDCTAEEARVEEIATDSEMSEHVNMFTCQMGGQQALAKWMGEHPIYSKPGWRIGRIKCVPGRYEKRGSV